MQSFRIVGLCILAAIVYGIVHDQFTARVCVEYFSVFHPPVFPTNSPTLLAIGWGIVATWWMGAFIGLFLAVAARAGSRKKIEAIELLRPISMLLIVMAALAAIAGVAGWLLCKDGVIAPPPWVASVLPVNKHAAFMADWWAHNASYLVGFTGGIMVCITTFRRRNRPLPEPQLS